MKWMGVVIVGCFLLACNDARDKKNNANKGSESSVVSFGHLFETGAVPYSLSDTALLANRDTVSLPSGSISSLLPDTLQNKLFGNSSRIKYHPLVRLSSKDKSEYLIVEGRSGNRKVALLLVFDSKGTYSAAMPFLVPDKKPNTTQVSSIDKSFAITKATTLRDGTEIAGEGKEVLGYDATEKRFTLIMTDLLTDNPEILVNPLDTFPKKHRLAGDYVGTEKNLVSVRDGRYPNQLLVYVHTEKNNGDCIGELKGEFILTSSTTAVYRQGGDPCVLELTFSGNTVALNEERGCGNYRGLDCPFTGIFTRKKVEKPSETIKKASRPKRPE